MSLLEEVSSRKLGRWIILTWNYKNIFCRRLYPNRRIQTYSSEFKTCLKNSCLDLGIESYKKGLHVFQPFYVVISREVSFSRRSRFQVDVEAVGWVVKKKEENKGFRCVVARDTAHANGLGTLFAHIGNSKKRYDWPLPYMNATARSFPSINISTKNVAIWLTERITPYTTKKCFRKTRHSRFSPIPWQLESLYLLWKDLWECKLLGNSTRDYHFSNSIFID